MTRLLLAAFSVGVLLLAGCNVFEGLYEEGASNDPEVLMADADLAMQRGEPHKAVAYLERALEYDPENPTIRTKLSTAILQANDIDVLSMISLAEEISGRGESGSATFVLDKHDALGATDAESCNFDAARKMSEIVLSNNGAFHSIKRHIAHLRRVHELLRTVVSDSSKLDRLTHQLKQTALLNSAISEVLLVLHDVEEKKFELGAALWQLSNDDVGLCARDEVSLSQIQSFVKCQQIPRLVRALELLTQRLGRVADEESGAKDAMEQIQRNIELLEAELDVEC